MINNDNERVLLEAMLYAMEGKSPSLAIEDQEKREQQKVVRSCRLPKKVGAGIPDECKNKGIPHWMSPEFEQMSWKERETRSLKEIRLSGRRRSIRSWASKSSVRLTICSTL